MPVGVDSSGLPTMMSVDSGFPTMKSNTTSSTAMDEEEGPGTRTMFSSMDMSIDKASYQFPPKPKMMTKDEIDVKESDWSRIFDV